MEILTSGLHFYVLFKIFIRERERKHEHGGGQWEGENPQADCPLSAEPEARLNPRTLRG